MSESDPLLEYEVDEYLKMCMDIPVMGGVYIPYMFGLWLEREFRVRRKIEIDWQVLHRLAKEFCTRNGLSEFSDNLNPFDKLPETEEFKKSKTHN